jgi:ion channel-forming bestrophin family protein
MVIYNPKDWWKLIFAFHKSDTFRSMVPGIMVVMIYTAFMAYIENDVFHATFKNTTVIHSLVGFVLSMLLVFRTNTAYDRWWEGRKTWGSLVNNTRNLAMKLHVLRLSDEQNKIFRDLLSNYIWAVKEHLREGSKISDFLTNTRYPIAFYDYQGHMPNHIMKAIYIEFHTLYTAGKIDGHYLVYLNDHIQSFTDNLGICERIKKTPIPYSYSLFFKKVIFLYIFTMPIGFVREFGYWAAPIVGILFYIFAGIELMAEEIEDPFGLDDNDLPTDTIHQNLHQNLTEILQ